MCVEYPIQTAHLGGGVILILMLRQRWITYSLIGVFTALASSCVVNDSSRSQNDVSFEFSELSWSSVDVAPDGDHLVVSALGNLYTLPTAGGRAQLLHGGPAMSLMPRFSPDGESIAFVSNSNGENFDLWLIDSQGGPAQLIVDSDYHVLYPQWSADGQNMVAFLSHLGHGISSDRESFGLSVLDLSGKGSDWQRLPTRGGGSSGYPSVTDSGMIFFLGTGGIYSLDKELKETKLVVSQATYDAILLAPKVSRDGKKLAFYLGNEEQLDLVVRDLATSEEKIFALRSQITHPSGSSYLDRFLKSRRPSSWMMVPDYSFGPDSESIYLVFDGRLLRFDLESLVVSNIPFTAIFSETLPDLALRKTSAANSRFAAAPPLRPSHGLTGQSIVYDTMGRIWVDSLNGTAPELLRIGQVDQRLSAPILSPGLDRIAYVGWNDTSGGTVFVGSIESAVADERVANDQSRRFWGISWSPCGRRIAVASRGINRDGRFSRKDGGRVSLMDVESGKETIIYLSSSENFLSSHNSQPLFFSSSGQHLYFVTQNFLGVKILKSIEISTGEIQEVFRITSDLLSYLALSPDTQKVALVFGGVLWIANISELAALDKTITKTSLPTIAQASPSNSLVVYAFWSGPNHLFSVSGPEVRRWDLESNQTTLVSQSVGAPYEHTTPKGRITFFGGHILKMNQHDRSVDGAIVVDGNRIRYVGSTANSSNKGKSIDLTNKYIVPGFIDSHGHPNSNYFPEFLNTQNAAYLSHLAYGVTTVYAAADGLADTFDNAHTVAAGEMLGPRILPSGGPIMARPFDNSPGHFYLDSSSDANRIVSLMQLYGSAMLKSYAIPFRDSRIKLLASARNAGLGVTTHFTGEPWAPLEQAIEGHVALEHPIGIPLFNDWARLKCPGFAGDSII